MPQIVTGFMADSRKQILAADRAGRDAGAHQCGQDARAHLLALSFGECSGLVRNLW